MQSFAETVINDENTTTCSAVMDVFVNVKVNSDIRELVQTRLLNVILSML